MRLVSLDLNNFRQHKKTRLEFHPGVTGVIGKNGCGKTTILEAIAWALYGNPAIRGNNSTIRCSAAEGNSPVEVKLVFDLGAHTYTVIRRLEPSGKSSANLAVDGMQSRSGFREVTDSITRLLGMNYQAFFTSFFTAQKELDFMRGMDGRERASAVSRMLGYERLLKARDKANSDRLGLAKEIEGIERGLGNLDEIIARKEAGLEAIKKADKAVAEAEKRRSFHINEFERLKPLREISEQKSKLASELLRRLELDNAEEKRASQRVKELSDEYKDLLAKEKELESLLPKVEEFRNASNEYHKLAELQKHEAKRNEITGSLNTLVKDIESLHARVGELAGAPGEMSVAERESVDLGKQIADLEERIQKQRDVLSAAKHRAEAEVNQLSSQREEIIAKRQKIEQAGPDGKCPTCERPLGTEQAKVLEGFDNQIKKLDERISRLQKQVIESTGESETLSAMLTLKQTLTKQREDATTRLAEASARNSELTRCKNEIAKKRVDEANYQSQLDKLPTGFDQKRYNELRELGTKLKPVNDRAVELRTALARKEAVNSDLNREKEALTRASESIKAAQTSLKELAFSQEEHEAVVNAYEAAQAALNASNIEVERLKGELKVAQTAYSSAENDEKAYRSKEALLLDKRKTRLHLQTLAEALDKLRNDLNSRTAPELAAAASDLLADMTDGRYSSLQVSDGFEATIIDDGELKQIISGGEEDVVNLALRLAVSRMIADRAGQDLSLLVLDEVFGSLDDIRRENVIGLLQTLKARFEQIILITHVESIHDAMDNCIWVDYDEAAKISTVRTKDAALDIGLQ